MKKKYYPLEDAQVDVLVKIASRSGMDCWFIIDENNYVINWEEGGKRMPTAEAVEMLSEGMTSYEDYDLTEDEIRIFEAIPGAKRPV